MNYNAAPRLLCVMIALLSCIDARGEIDIGLPAPPQAVPLKVRVPRGGTVEIPLRAFGIHNQQLRFRIRAAPAHGKLSEPKTFGRELGSVLYSHSGEHDHHGDRFTYAVQSAAGISAPARVQVRIVDQPPIFVVPELLDSGEALIGTASRTQVPIENRGGGIIRGTAKVNEPWRLEQSDFQLRPGEQKNLPLVFQPQKEQIFTGAILFTGDINRSTSLRGSGLAPIAIEPQQITLQAKPGQLVREAALRIFNRTAEPQIVQVAASEKLLAPEQIELEPHRVKSLPVQTDARGSVEGDLFLRAPGYHMRVPVQAAPSGAIFHAQPKALTLGKSLAPAELKVSNAGGTRGFLRAEISPPFEIVGTDAVPLEPGEEKAVRVRLHRGTAAGKYRTWLVLQGEEQRFEIPIDGQVTATKTVAAAPVTKQKQPRKSMRVTREPEFSDVPPVTDLRIERAERRAAEVSWKAPRSEPLQYHIEQRLLSLTDEGELKIDWMPLKKVRIEQNSDKFRAKISGLAAGGPYALRIISINEAGEHSRPSAVLTFQTQPKPKLKLTPLRVLLVIFAGLVFTIAWQRYRRQKG
jgi:hypothetical protein